MTKQLASDVTATYNGTYVALRFFDHAGNRYHVNLTRTGEHVSPGAFETLHVKSFPFILYRHPPEGTTVRYGDIKRLDPRAAKNAPLVDAALAEAKRTGLIAAAVAEVADKEAAKQAAKDAERAVAARAHDIQTHAEELYSLVRKFVEVTNDRFPFGFPDASLCSREFNEPMAEAARIIAEIEGS